MSTKPNHRKLTMRRLFRYRDLSNEITGWFPYSVVCYAKPKESGNVRDSPAFAWLLDNMGRPATYSRFSRPRNRVISQQAYVFLNEEARWDVLGPTFFFRDRTDATAFRLVHG